MNVLLLIPSVAVQPEGETATDRPRMDYDALAACLRRSGDTADIVDYRCLDTSRGLMTGFVRRVAGRDAALAWIAFVRRKQYDVVYTNGENIGIPLALLFKASRRRPGHVTIGHRLSTGKKRIFFTLFQAQRQIDCILVYSSTQLAHARDALRLPAAKLKLISFQADERFFHALPDTPVNEKMICSAGLEWRDYPTLIEAVRSLPDLDVRLAAASPWSKHVNETERQTLPPHVQARRYDYGELRQLYAESCLVVVPLYENDFQAGVTTILEAMAMSKAVIVTRTTGQVDVVVDGVTGLLVAPGDVDALRKAIVRLRDDPALRKSLGDAGRTWLEEHATLEGWVENVVAELRTYAVTNR